MKGYIYMNEHIRERVPRKPPIVVKRGRRTRFVREVPIVVGGREIGRVTFPGRRLRGANHNVRVWVEFDYARVKLKGKRLILEVDR